MKKNSYLLDRNNFLFLLFILYSLLFTIIGCARGGDEPPKKVMEINLKVAGNIDANKGVYWIAFDTDGDRADGPYFTENRLSNTTHYISLKNNLFTFNRIIIYQDGSQGIETSPYSAYAAFSGNSITVRIEDFSILGNPTYLDVNLFTFISQTNETGETEYIVIDGLGEVTSDADVLHFDLQSQTYLPFTDDLLDVSEDKADFNIKEGYIRILTITSS